MPSQACRYCSPCVTVASNFFTGQSYILLSGLVSLCLLVISCRNNHNDVFSGDTCLPPRLRRWTDHGAVNLGARVLDFLLLAGIFIIAARMSFRSFGTRNKAGTFLVSRVIAGVYSLLLAAAAVYAIVLLFVPNL